MRANKKREDILLDEDCLQAVTRPDGVGFKAWLPLVQIQHEQGGVGPLHMSPTQRPVYHALRSHPWVIVCKPRQAQTSTLCAAWLLHQVQYNAGNNGLLIANKSETNSELWSRIRLAHERLPPEVRVPSTTEHSREISFRHGGRLRATTAAGRDPAIGMSIDALLGSEFGFWPDADIVWGKIAPTLAKRKHARVVLESTPSSQGSLFQTLLYSALAGTSNFYPVFIAWWKYAAYTRPALDFKPDNEELSIIDRLPGITYGHLAFRRHMLDDVYAGDTRRFQQCYPDTAHDGWYGGGTPTLPEEDLKALLPHAIRPDPPYMQTWQPPTPGSQYIIFVDPAGYGVSGDPSAYTVFDAHTGVEMSAWSGRVDPAKFGRDLAAMGARMNNALIVVESNAAACITSLVNTGYRNIFNDGGDAHPGYYRTRQTKERAIARLVEMLRTKRLNIRSAAGIYQLLSWDGTGNRSGGHHWDRVITYQMAADILRDRSYTQPQRPPPVPPGFISVRDTSPRQPIVRI